MKDILNEIKNGAKLIKESEFDCLFDELWSKAKNKVMKLETEQQYECDMDFNYKKYLEKNYDELLNFFKEFSINWPKILENKRKLKFERLHLVKLPMTKYLEYEMYFYLMNEKAGEKIKCLTFEGENIEYNGLMDFIIFDYKEIIINIHNNGKYICSYYSNNSPLIQILSKEFEKEYKKAIRYKKIFKFDSYILNKMKSQNLI